MGCSCSQPSIHPEESKNSSIDQVSSQKENSNPTQTEINNNNQNLHKTQNEEEGVCEHGNEEEDTIGEFFTSQDIFTNETQAGIHAFPSFFNPDKKPLIFEYQFCEHIGKGARSDVFRVINTENNNVYAAKVYDKSYLFRRSIGDAEPPITKFTREVQIMGALNHPNCLSLVEILDDDCTNSLIMIFPFARCGSLSPFSWKANPLPEDQLHKIFLQVANGIQHMHSLNILRLDEETAVISDFSASICLDDDPDELLEDTDGTPAFYSPEECSGDAYRGKPVDIWALGMTIYVLAVGKLPFLKSDDVFIFSQFVKIANCIMHDDINYPENLSSGLVNLLSHMLDKNPDTRYTIDQVCSDPWLSS